MQSSKIKGTIKLLVSTLFPRCDMCLCHPAQFLILEDPIPTSTLCPVGRMESEDVAMVSLLSSATATRPLCTSVFPSLRHL